MKKITLFLILFLAQFTFGQDPQPHFLSHSKSPDGIETVWFLPNNKGQSVSQYEKLELGLRLSDQDNQNIEQFVNYGQGGINPFDPEQVEIKAYFTSPLGEIKKVVNGFYYRPYMKDIKSNRLILQRTDFPWRIRFSPDQVGKWMVKIEVIIAGESSYNKVFNFECTVSNHRGRITTSTTETEKDRYLYYQKTGEPFYAVGGNICHASYDFDFTLKDNELHKMWLGKLADAGGNIFRLELGPQTALPDWNALDNYSSRLAEMFLFDDLIDYAQLRNLYFILFRHHTEVNHFWKDNPYVKAYGLTDNPNGYYTNEEIIKQQQNTLRYIFARWGYSPSFAFYEYQEIDRWMTVIGASSTGQMEKKYNNIFKEWFIKNTMFIKEELNEEDIMISAAYATLPDYEVNNPLKSLYNYCDVIAFHQYGSHPNVNIKTRYNKTQKLWKKFGKPVIIEEMGDDARQIPLYCCTDMSFHHDLWATAMMGSIGTGLHWWWDRGIYLNDYQKQYKTIQLFFDNEKIRQLEFNPYKWVSYNNSKEVFLENYSLISSNKENILGWVRNASYHWRNLYETDSCIQHLVEKNVAINKCVFEDGWVNHKTDITFSDPKYVFKDGKVHPIVFKNNLSENPTFEISGLRYSFLPRRKKHWYKVEFYNTRNTDKLEIDPRYTQTIHTNTFSKIKVFTPNMDGKNNDWAYKITYLGFYKK